MTDNNHPITPRLRLVDEWYDGDEYELAVTAARWGADQELEALLTWLRVHHFDNLASDLLAARRPKPPSLKEQALAKLPEHPENMASHLKLTPGEVATIRRALESLPD